MDRLPHDLILTTQDFQDSGWYAVLATPAGERYSAMWQAFSAEASKATEAGESAKAKVLFLLSDATSMRLTPGSKNEPFSPMTIFGNRRSAMPGDFTPADLDFFQALVPLVDHPKLRARLADIVWLCKKPRVVAMATAAVDAYRQVSPTSHEWTRDGRSCWTRAVSLARMLGIAGADQLQQLEAEIRAAFDAATQAERFFARQVADLMEGHGLAHSDRASVAAKLETLAEAFVGDNDSYSAREYFEASARWHRAAGDMVKAAEMTAAEAECWVKQAQGRSEGSAPSHIVALGFYENAIQTYRNIPGAHRSVLGVEDRIESLRALLANAGQKSLAEMHLVQTEPIDITGLVRAAREQVSGKSLGDALARFVLQYPGPNVKELRDQATARMQESPLAAIASSTTMSADGRVIAKRPALGVGSPDSAQNSLWAEMVKQFMFTVQVLVQGEIVPALHVLLLEHRLGESDFVSLARSSPVIPKDRARLVGKGLFSGYDGDFISAVHILVPQLENVVRQKLKAAGVITSQLSREGIETENGLSTLMDISEAEAVLGEPLCFEIKAMFCTAAGPNLRNDLAHGLLDDESSQSIAAVYSWWFMLRLVLSEFWAKEA